MPLDFGSRFLRGELLMKTPLIPGPDSHVLRRQTLQKLETVYRDINRAALVNSHPVNLEVAIESLKGVCERSIHTVSAAEHDTALLVACTDAVNSLRSILIPMLGMIVRASNLRLAFELYYPLRRMTWALFGEKTALLLASNWNYYPDTHVGHTFPLVIIGLPAIDSSNALIVPLAGHEFGHNLWDDQGLSSEFDSRVNEALRQVCQRDEAGGLLTEMLGKSHLEANGQPRWDSLEVKSFVSTLTSVVSAQLEEHFCDALALRLFAESYLKALCYLCVPGPQGRDDRYPPLTDRLRHLQQFAREIRVDWCVSELACTIGIERSTVRGRLVRLLVDTLAPAVQRCARRLATDRRMPLRNRNRVDQISRQFRNLVPVGGKQTLTDIINAAWQVSDDLETARSLKFEPERWRELVNQMALKTCEVTEYHERLDS
jgi:hypothetical protein